MSQVNFFMLNEDILEFSEIILKNNDMVLLFGRRFNNENPEPINDLSLLIGHRYATIVSSTLFGKYPPAAVFDESNKELWMYDLFKGPAIDFDIPYFINTGELISGRIYAKIGWLDSKEDNKIYKSSYSRLDRWIKKHYIKVEDIWWISNRVKEWSLNGGILVFGDELAFSKQLTEKDFK